MILMDAGIDYFGYVSDITRTWPASGRYEGAQLALYEAVLEVHQALLEVGFSTRHIFFVHFIGLIFIFR